jgi:predicted secreted Zn-dependent protease
MAKPAGEGRASTVELSAVERPNFLLIIADDPKSADIKARLGKQLDAWMAQQGDRGMETELKAKSRQGQGTDAGPPDEPAASARKKAARRKSK